MLNLLHGGLGLVTSAAITGSARKIKDNAADWHNMMLRWDRLNEDGFMAAASIECQVLMDHVIDQSEICFQCSERSTSCVTSFLVSRQAAVVTKMDRLMTSQRGVEDLEAFQFGAEGRKTPLFHSWSTREFGEISQVLLDSFRRELLLKQTILQEVAHTVTSDLCMVFLSGWLHQPFIPTQSRLRLEALLLETGHRPL
uniref:Cyclin dependent kinase 2 interacting protein n=1 Tax=Oreochromis niloticus TaxID=8128 RepID=A0A669BMD6_ORENI